MKSLESEEQRSSAWEDGGLKTAWFLTGFYLGYFGKMTSVSIFLCIFPFGSKPPAIDSMDTHGVLVYVQKLHFLKLTVSGRVRSAIL